MLPPRPSDADAGGNDQHPPVHEQLDVNPESRAAAQAAKPPDRLTGEHGSGSRGQPKPGSVPNRPGMHARRQDRYAEQERQEGDHCATDPVAALHARDRRTLAGRTRRERSERAKEGARR
jgi:hypothetical protein